MQDRKSLYSRSCIFFGVHYLILLLVFMVFSGTYGYPGGFWQGLWMTIATLTYPIIYLLPGAGATWLLLLSRRRGMHLADQDEEAGGDDCRRVKPHRGEAPWSEHQVDDEAVDVVSPVVEDNHVDYKQQLQEGGPCDGDCCGGEVHSAPS